MNKLSDQKFKLFFSIFALICASLACNIPDVEKAVTAPEDKIAENMVDDVFHSDCSSADRSQYEQAVATLGGEPETPKYLEGATYYVCYGSDGLYRAYMIDGNGPEDIEQTESESKTSISTGTYKGSIEDTEWKQRDWFGSPADVPGTVAENEVIIFIAEDGTVTGSLKYIVNGTVLTSDTSHGITCTVLNDRSYDGEASGKLLEHTGMIIFVGEWHEVTSYSERCNIEEHESATLQDIEIHTQVEIKNGTMYGTSVPSEGSRFHEISIILHSD